MNKIERAKKEILDYAKNNHQFTLQTVWNSIGGRLGEQHVGYTTYAEAFVELLAVDKKIFSLMTRNINKQALFGLWES